MQNKITINGVELTESQTEIVGAIVASEMLGFPTKLTAEQKTLLREVFSKLR